MSFASLSSFSSYLWAFGLGTPLMKIIFPGNTPPGMDVVNGTG